MRQFLKIAAITIVVICSLFALTLALLSAFDWNRAKPWISDKVSAATGRSFAINGDLSLSWQRPPHADVGWQRFIPWPHLRAQNVVLGNPDWATTGPDMARIRQVDFTIDPFALLHKTVAVQSLVLVAPNLVLEQGAGKRANWQFQHEDKQSAWQMRIEDIGLEQGRVRYVDPEKKADFTTDIDTMKDGSVKWRSNGRFNQDTLSGVGTAGAILSLQASNVRYPVKAEITVGQSKISIDGTLTNPTHASALDVNLKILGASMADLFAFSGVLLPQTPKFSIEGRLAGSIKPGTIHLHYRNFKGKVGSSDLEGTLEYVQQQPRSVLRGDIVSHYLDIADLRPLIGAGSQDEVKNKSGIKQPPDKLLPVSPFKTDRWKTMDAQVQFTGEKIIESKRLPLRHMKVRLRLDDGVLSLAPLDFDIAGGSLKTEVHIDGRKEPAKGEMKVSARGLQLRELFPTIEAMHASAGQLHGDAALNGSGNSIAALLATSNGSAQAVMTEGSISKFILEAMGLNIGAAVAAKLFNEHQVQVNCMLVDLDAKNGVMQTRTFVIDTKDELIAVNGDVDFANEKIALKIHPQTKGLRLFSLRSPLHVAGTFKKPDIGVDKGPVALKAGAAVALGTVAAPLAALVALIHPGAGAQSPCGALTSASAK
jgi:hypothetical protein